MTSLNKEVALIIGASRGIGRRVAVDLAKNDYHVVVAAKTTSDAASLSSFPPDPNSAQSTINTVAREITEAGGSALALPVDVRDVDNVKDLVDEVVRRLGRLDVLVYNSGAIWWSAVETTPVKRFLLLQQVNPQGLYAAVSAALPHFGKQGWKGRIIVVSPPIYSRFFRGKTAYAIGKVRQGRKQMAITSIWPASSIESAATGETVKRDPEAVKDLRKAEIYSDAIIAMLQSPAEEVNGLLDTDEDFLRKKGVTDFSKYSLVPGATPRRIMPAEFPVLEVAEQDDEGRRVDSVVLRQGREKSKL
ncbi:hypothetical protein H2200_001838 [Cladophialophora chaetospira]|uniref:Short chain dehydrogenase n=1 Tax=Cladophialophora chaetospira TaxID=386627 RepID=A0AA39CPF8_9EURO|nr:hypothetical protein H2200_001838 [Cladophialophora chaetospira]